MDFLPAAALALVVLTGCQFDRPEGALVPPTVVDDPRLPAISVTVGGQPRGLHVRTYGDPAAPVFLVLHGSLSDMRASLPFRRFADRYRVVFWDAGGNGLSQRLDRSQLSPDRMVEEIQAVKENFSPGDVVQLILMEPFGLRDRFMDDLGGACHYDFTPGLASFPGEVLLVGSSASPTGYRLIRRGVGRGWANGFSFGEIPFFSSLECRFRP